MDFITQLFTQLNTTDSITVLAFLFGAFIIGWLFGRMSISRKLKRANKALKLKEGELSTLSIEHGALRQQFEQREEKLSQLEAQNKDLRHSFMTVENEKNELTKELYFSKQHQQEVEDINAQYLNQLGLLEGELEMIKSNPHPVHNHTQNFEMGADHKEPNQVLEPTSDNWRQADDRLSKIELKLAKLESENHSLRNEVVNIQSTERINLTGENDAEMRYLKLKLDRLERENEALLKQLGEKFEEEEQEEIPVDIVFDDEQTVSDVVFEDDEDDMDLLSPEERASKARRQLERFMGTKIPKAESNLKDDLKAINGIGPFIEQKLNAVGIFTFDQISEFDDDLINLLTEAIQFFPGRIKRDDWVNQAGSLKKNKDEE